MLKSLKAYLFYSTALFDPRREGAAAATGGEDPPAGGAEGGAEGAGGTDDATGDPPEAGTAAAAGDGTGDPPAGDGDPPPEPARTDWRDKELRRKHAQLKQREREAADLRAENESLRAMAEGRSTRQPAAGADDPPAPAARTTDRQPAAAPSDDEVNARAQTIVARQRYDDDCNAADAAGKKTFGAEPWKKALETLETLGGIPDIDDMVHILATDDPAKVLYDLGSNPELYQQVMELPPAKRRTELIKIAIKPAPKGRKVSDAPAPIDPVSGRPTGTAANAGDIYNDKLDDDNWYKIRQRQKAEKFAREQGTGARG